MQDEIKWEDWLIDFNIVSIQITKVLPDSQELKNIYISSEDKRDNYDGMKF